MLTDATKLQLRLQGPNSSKSQVVVGDADLANAVTRVQVDASAGEIPRITLTLLLFTLDGDLDTVQVEVPPETHAALVKLGWTPPAD